MANLQPVRRPPDDVPSAATTFVSSPRTPKSSHDYLPAAPPLPRLQPTTDAQPDQTKATEPELSDQTNLLPLRQVAVVFMGLSVALFVSLMAQTMVSTALPTIGAEFGDSRQSGWVATAYLLTSTAFQPLYGRFSDIFGRKYTLIFALSIFMVGSLGAALSRTMIQLICLQAVAGMGGGAIITLCMVIISDVVSLKQRGKFQGITGTVVVLSNSIGPLIGGVFTQKYTWRWIFWICLPLGALSIVVVIFVLPLRRVTGSWRDKAKKIDYLGSLLILAGSISLLIPISWGGTEYAWDSVAVILPLILGFGIFGLFVWVETKVALPIVPLSIFKNITATGVILSTFLSGFIFYTQLYFLPSYFQIVLGVSTIRSGVLLFGLIIPQTVFSFFSGFCVSFTGEYRINLMVGFALWTIGVGLLSTLTADSGLGKIIGYQLLAGAGAGQTFQTGLVALQASVPRSQMAVVTALRNFVRLLGGTVALAIAQALLNNAVQNALSSSGAFTQAQIDSIAAAPARIHDGVTLTEAERLLVVDAYTVGLHHVWYMAIPCAGLSFFLAVFCIKAHDLNRADDAAQKEAAKEWAARHKLSKGERHAFDLEKGAASASGAQTPTAASVGGPELSSSERRSLERAIEHGRQEDLARAVENELVHGAERRKEERKAS